MNTHAHYRRYGHEAPKPEVPQTEASSVSELAHRRDPSLTPTASSRQPSGKRIAWVRPTDLAAHAEPLIGRGISLHAELLRRARRGPGAATRSIRRTTNPTPTTPTPTKARQEGISL